MSKVGNCCNGPVYPSQNGFASPAVGDCALLKFWRQGSVFVRLTVALPLVPVLAGLPTTVCSLARAAHVLSTPAYASFMVTS